MPRLKAAIILIKDYSSNNLQDLNVPDDVLVVAQKNLFALKELLDTNPYLFHSAPGDHTGARSASVNEQEAWKVCLYPLERSSSV